MRYVTTDELIFINERLPSSKEIHKILKGKQIVRDMTLLEAAAARPTTTVFGEDAYPTTQEKGAALLHSISRNHPFSDGNKRTATIALLFMLEINGLRVTWNREEALEKIIAVAEGKGEMRDLAGWMPVEPCPPSPEPDETTDIATIERIMREHQWLLDELAKR